MPIDDNQGMRTRESSVYQKWIKNLGDERARYRINARKEIIILLCGGDKTTQQADIARARVIAENYVLEE